MKSITRFYSISIGVNGNGHAHFNSIPFRVKQINVKSVVIEDNNDTGAGQDLFPSYYVLWSDCMPNTPLALIGGSSTLTTWDGTAPVYQNFPPNGLSSTQVSYYVYPPQLYAGQIQFRLRTLADTSPTLVAQVFLGVILEFISGEEE